MIELLRALNAFLDRFDPVIDQIVDSDLESEAFQVFYDAVLEDSGRDALLDEMPNGWFRHNGLVVAPPAMIPIPAGIFTMGSNTGFADEAPAHKVAMPAFAIMSAPVTQELWSAVMGNNPSTFIGVKRPVESVSWYDCVEFCNRLSELCGLQPPYSIEYSEADPPNVTWDLAANGYRLPTEAEWEYAARGTDARRYPWGDENPGGAYLHWQSAETCDVGLHPAGASPFGAEDMAGNVWEWVWDSYDSEAYTKQAEAQRPIIKAIEEHRKLFCSRGSGYFGGDYEHAMCRGPSYGRASRSTGLRLASNLAYRVARGHSYAWNDHESDYDEGPRASPTYRCITGFSASRAAGLRLVSSADNLTRVVRGSENAADRWNECAGNVHHLTGLRLAQSQDDAGAIIRGSNWSGDAAGLRAAYRGLDKLTDRDYSFIGFRCVR